MNGVRVTGRVHMQVDRRLTEPEDNLEKGNGELPKQINTRLIDP